MASDAARKDARERSLGGAALRLLALLALAAVVIRTRAVLAAARVGDAVGARAERVRALEHELLELAARQRAVDAELAAAAPAAPASAPAASEAPPEAKPRAAAAAAPAARPATPFATTATWGARGPPPDAFFATDRCAAPRRNASAEGIFWYDRPDAEACARARISLRGEAACPGEGERRGPAKRQILVTGVQRSGTHFTWEMLARLGIHVHHEGLGPAGSVSWLFTWKAATYVINNPASLDARRHRFCVVFHQVRHPLRVISSVVRATRAHDRFWDWLYGVEPGLDRTDPPVRRAARLWLLQNRRLEKIADARFLVEETSPRAVCSAAGFPDFLCRGDGRHHATSSKVVQPILEPRRLARSEALRVPSKVPAVSWADVERLDAALAAACRDLAAAYGYDADPRYHPQSLDTTAFKA